MTLTTLILRNTIGSTRPRPAATPPDSAGPPLSPACPAIPEATAATATAAAAGLPYPHCPATIRATLPFQGGEEGVTGGAARFLIPGWWTGRTGWG